MRDSMLQRRGQQHKSLKVTQNATNGIRHINDAPKQTNANNLFKISFKYMHGMLSNWKICVSTFT